MAYTSGWDQSVIAKLVCRQKSNCTKKVSSFWALLLENTIRTTVGSGLKPFSAARHGTSAATRMSCTDVKNSSWGPVFLPTTDAPPVDSRQQLHLSAARAWHATFLCGYWASLRRISPPLRGSQDASFRQSGPQIPETNGLHGPL